MRWFQFSAVVFVTLFFAWSFFAPQPSVSTQITTCDVGQGDAILIQHGTFTMLIDTGPNSDVLECLSQKLPFWRPTIDVLVLSHSDWDHIGGVESVLTTFQIREVWRTPWTDLNSNAENVEEMLSAYPQRFVEAGETLSVPGLRARVVWGNEIHSRFLSQGKVEDSSNARSVGVFLIGESFGFLSLGDLGCQEELAVASMSLLKQVQILKVSHHGSKTSSCLEFLKKITPETALISAGKGNSYGHPSSLPLENLRILGALILRTDQLGSFTLDIPGR